ncbi:tRNA lysidine(34) synthetase TilS [Thalassospiraceae bacterium LMO-SO8]|nr:tRNA lysidine(34) synthetase TilS [Alphaproteobacteria bacterium LMO-S08]WND75115.1 tRNA lysidine(34) synthetase TilS [Thalassospiraceae bacterium LMO-SO8]
MMTATAHPLSNDDADGLGRRFAKSMDRLGPFETAPHLAVAVSGGADSTALALLAQDWAAERDGRVTALIVDHGLRGGSAAEAAGTAARLQSLGIVAHILTWDGAKPAASVQAAARAARYGLLRNWCRTAGVLHLLAGHHGDDQAETHVMRQSRGGGFGAAGMSALVSFPELRLLRPLLGIRHGALTAYLAAKGVAWIEDPSNANTDFERVRIRRRLVTDAGLADRALAEAHAAGVARQKLQDAVNRALAETVSPHPLGFADLDRRAFAGLAPDVAGRLAARLAQVLGGADHAPPAARADRLARRIAGGGAFPGGSLGRCRFLADKAGCIVVCRDGRGLPAPMAVSAGRVASWDGRFAIVLPAGISPGVVLAPLGPEGWRQIPKDMRRASGLPSAAARTLPALFENGTLLAHAVPGGGAEGLSIRFRAKNTLAFNGFCIA